MTQRLQMISVTDPNIHNIALDGNFDDCQVRAASTPAPATQLVQVHEKHVFSQ